MFGIGFAEELPGHFILTLHEAKGTLTEVIGGGDAEVADSFRIIVLVLL